MITVVNDVFSDCGPDQSTKRIKDSGNSVLADSAASVHLFNRLDDV